MTITEANAVNEVARRVIAGVQVSNWLLDADLEHGIAVLLINAYKVLKAGYTVHSFLARLDLARKIAKGRRV